MGKTTVAPGPMVPKNPQTGDGATGGRKAGLDKDAGKLWQRGDFGLHPKPKQPAQTDADVKIIMPKPAPGQVVKGK